MTQKLNNIITRFALHEMRTQANIVLVQKIKAYMADLHDSVDKDVRPKSSGSDAQSKALLKSGNRLNARLDHLESEQRALLLELSCNEKIASSQVQIVRVALVELRLFSNSRIQVFNLIAQTDNRDNLEMAGISTEIAIVTKEDSFAMRTLSVMSVVFLPGTFVAVSGLYLYCPLLLTTSSIGILFHEYVQLASGTRPKCCLIPLLDVLGSDSTSYHNRSSDMALLDLHS
jgi:hypothetical protein